MNRIWVTNTGECSDGIAAMRHAFQPDHVINSGDGSYGCTSHAANQQGLVNLKS